MYVMYGRLHSEPIKSRKCRIPVTFINVQGTSLHQWEYINISSNILQIMCHGIVEQSKWGFSKHSLTLTKTHLYQTLRIWLGTKFTQPNLELGPSYSDFEPNSIQ